VSWRSISQRAGVALDLTVASFAELKQSVGPALHSERLWDVEPSEGCDAGVSLNLASILRFHTRSPGRVEFAVWEGCGNAAQVLADAPDLVLPGRGYKLVSGPISLASDVTGYRMPASLWWSVEQEWLVASDIDQQATYVGGPVELIAAVLSSGSVEAFRVEPGYRITSEV
jgi:hypothetical protein